MTSAFKPHRYYLNDALRITHALEEKLPQHGYHCAVGGSCMYRGWSDKDIDIFLYPHSHASTLDKVQLYTLLESFGFKPRKDKDLEEDPRYLAEVYVSTQVETGVDVDFFILERPKYRLLIDPSDNI